MEGGQILWWKKLNHHLEICAEQYFVFLMKEILETLTLLESEISETFSFQHLPNPSEKEDEKHDLYRGFLIPK